MANTAVTLTSNTVAFAAWDRALSNADIAMLSAGFPVVP